MGLCKLCLLDCTSYIDIFGEQGMILNIASIVSQHFWFDVSKYDTLSTIICDNCWYYTHSFNKFYVNIQDAHKNFIESTKIIKHESKEEVSVDLDPILYDQNSQNSSDNEDTSIKNEETEELHNDDDHHGEQPTESSEEEHVEEIKVSPAAVAKKRAKRKVKTKPKPKKKIKIEEEKYSDEEDCVDDELQQADNDDDDDDDEDDDKTPNKVTNPRKEIRAKEDAQIREYCQMNCEVCGILLKTLLDAQKHYKDEHDTVGYLICCNRKLFRRSRVLDHITSGHIDPNAFRCDICNKIYMNKLSLKNHMDSHATVDQKPFKCDLCSSTFTKNFRLTKHKLETHCSEEDKKFSCTHCPKNFMTQRQLNSHVKYVHEADRFICEFCAKEFKNTQQLNAHRGIEHLGETVPKLQCSVCGSWLKGKDSLRTHLKRHKDVMQTCKICGKVLQNKNSLGNHMRNVHGGRIHRCLLCDKSFPKAISLREHMALHTGQDLYTCPYCPKTFKSSANMHSHRKKAHYLDWEKDRGKRFICTS